MEMKLVEEELKKGWEATSKLRSLLLFLPELKSGNENSKRAPQNLCSDNDNILPFLESHYNTIINSFNTSISILKQYSQSSSMPLICQETKYTPKKRSSRMIEISNLGPDGYAWRKYGEKPTLNSEHPREYYRCGYRDDQNCLATKHVQKISSSPTKYKIIYYAHHSCNPILHNNNVPRISDPFEKDCNNIISFESNNSTQIPKQNLKKPSALILPSSSNTPSKALSSEYGECPTLQCKITNNPPPCFVDSKKNANPPLASNTIIGDANQQQDVLLSPSILMSPNYMATTSHVDLDRCDFAAGYEQFYDMEDALQLQDIPFSEMNVSPLWE